MTLADFLVARIAEDEETCHFLLSYAVESGAHPGACHPARVLAECEAKRRIVERAAVLFGASGLLDGAADRAYEYDDNVLPLLALPYAGHPEYQQEWKP